MTFNSRDLMRFGLTAALLSSTSLAACGGEAGQTDETPSAPAVMGEAGESASYAGEGEGGEGESGAHAPETLPIQNRLAFMRGHVEAGLALYRAGAPEQAAKHLLHPVSETHAAEREGLDDLGFNGDLFVEISDALESGTESAAIEDKLVAAEENLEMLADNVGGSSKDILNFLLDTTLAEYRVGVVDGEIANAGEYQDAYGFVKVAEDYAGDLDGDAGDAVRSELEALRRMWPDAPLADSLPRPVDDIASQISRVQLELSGVR